MKKTQILLAPAAMTLLLASAAASAQTDTTVYGRIVAGVDFSTNASSDGVTSGNRWSGASNQWGTSIFGIKGDEDLGGGLKAVFDLETGFGATTGVTNSSALFGRYAFVGLSSNTAGTIKFGEFLAIDNDVWFLDPMGQQWLSTATLVKGRSWNIADNAVQYESPNIGGFTANAQYSFGGVAGSTKPSSGGGVSLAYIKGPIELRAIYDYDYDSSGQFSTIFTDSKELILGGTATLGDAKIFAAYQHLSAPDALVGAPDKATHYWVGINYQATVPLQLLAAAYHINEDNGASSGGLYTIGANYSLSKRTLLYVTLGTVENGANGTFSEQYWQPHVPGQNQTSLYFGVSHNF